MLIVNHSLSGFLETLFPKAIYSHSLYATCCTGRGVYKEAFALEIDCLYILKDR